jgi:predicted transcriptional regulator
MNPPTEVMLLGYLFEYGASNARQLEVAAGDVDQITEQVITEWATDAEGRGLVERTGGAYWNITDTGRKRIGIDVPR